MNPIECGLGPTEYYVVTLSRCFCGHVCPSLLSFLEKVSSYQPRRLAKTELRKRQKAKTKKNMAGTNQTVYNAFSRLFLPPYPPSLPVTWLAIARFGGKRDTNRAKLLVLTTRN